MLGQFTGQQESDCSLDLPAGDGGALVVVGKTGGLSGDPLENVVHERVHDGHGLGADAGVRVDLLEHLVDVDAEAFLSLGASLLLVAGWCGLFDCLLGAFGWCHFSRVC